MRRNLRLAITVLVVIVASAVVYNFVYSSYVPCAKPPIPLLFAPKAASCVPTPDPAIARPS